MRPGFCLALCVALLLGASAAAQVAYFPPGSLSNDAHGDDFLSDWYSGQLRALKEPSLLELSKKAEAQSYRFLWLRTFHRPVAIRVDVNDDGTALLTTKMTDGQGGNDPGKLIQNETAALNKAQTHFFLKQIKEYDFWTLPSAEERAGADGAEWIVEGVKDGSYHIVSRWSPKDGEIRTIGLFMLHDLAKMKVPAKELY